MLRALAILCVVYGIFQIVYLIVFAGVQGLRYGWPMRYSGMRVLDVLMRCVMIGNAIILPICGWGLLKWKSYGRRGLLLWAVLEVSSYAIVNGVWLFTYASSRAATQPFTPSVSFIVWNTFSSLVQRSLFPMAVFFVLIQPEVAKLWAHASRGFDVLPVAPVAAEPVDTE